MSAGETAETCGYWDQGARIRNNSRSSGSRSSGGGGGGGGRSMDTDRDTIMHVLSRCEACQAGQVGTRVCVEKGHMATVASVKRSIRGNNLVDPYTEEEVDARYRLMLKPGESLTMLSTNAVIDGEVKFAVGTVFQQPPNTKSQTLLGCLKSGIPLEDFVLGGEGRRSGGALGRKDSLSKRERDKDSKKEGVSYPESKRKAPSSGISSSSKKASAAAIAAAASAAALNAASSVTSNSTATEGGDVHDAPQLNEKALAISKAEEAAATGRSGLTFRNLAFVDAKTEEVDERPAKREGTRSSMGTGAGVGSSGSSSNGASSGDGADAAVQATVSGSGAGDSTSQLSVLTAAEDELKASYDAHMKYLSDAEFAKKAEMDAFQRAGEAYLANIERSREATKEHGLALRKTFLEQRQRITRLRMEEVDSERERNRLESEKREARLKAEKEALSAACEQEAAELGDAWAAVEAAAGFNATAKASSEEGTPTTKSDGVSTHVEGGRSEGNGELNGEGNGVVG